MTFMLLVRGVTRNKLRAALTILATVAAFVGFILVRAVGFAWTAADASTVERVVTRHATSMQVGMPIRIIEKVRGVDGVADTTPVTWFGGRIPSEENESFTSLAVEPDSFHRVFPEYGMDEATLTRWKGTRDGAVIGEALASLRRWKVGDTVTLEAPMWPVEEHTPWKLTIVGIYKPLVKTAETSSMFIRYDFFNQRLTPAWRDQVRLIYSQLKPGRNSAEVGRAIDAALLESDSVTLTVDEATFSKGFIASISALLVGLDLISVALLAVATLLTASLVTMSTRERVREFGMLRAIGFSPGFIRTLVVGESSFLSLISAVAACFVGYLLIHKVIGPFLTENAPGVFASFPMPMSALGYVLVTALAGGLVAGLIPATFALRIRTTDALRDIG